MTSGSVDDGYWSIAQPALFYGTAFTNFFINSNGEITFGSGTTLASPDLASHFSIKRLSLYVMDLNAAAGNGEIRVGRVTTAGQQRTIVTFAGVEQYNVSTNKINVQAELWDSGVITITWLACTGGNPTVGLSNSTSTTPAGFVESNFSNYGSSSNSAPIFASLPPFSAIAGGPLTYQVIATDADEQPLTLTAVTLPSWLTLNASGNGRASLSGTPPASGVFPITLRASDGTFQTDQTFSLLVTPAEGNTAPVFTSVPPSSGIPTGVNFTYSISATDADGQALTFSALTLPAWLNFSALGNGTASLSGLAPDTDVLAHPVTLAVTDGFTTTLQSFTLLLDRVPVVTITRPLSRAIRLPDLADTLLLDASASDPNGNPVTVTWSQVSGPAPAVFTSAATLASEVKFPAAGRYSLRLTANDGSSASSRDLDVWVEQDGDAAIASGLLARWKCDDAIGTTVLADSSAANVPLTLSGATLSPGLNGNALTVDGANSRIATATLPASPQLSFACWMNPVSAPSPNENSLLMLLDNGSVRFRIYRPANATRLRILSDLGGTDGQWDIATPIPAGDWTHLVVTYDRSAAANVPHVFINGKSTPLLLVATPTGTVQSNPTQVRLGGDTNANKSWNGRLDDLRFYNRILTPTDASLLLATGPLNIAPNVSAGNPRDLAAGTTTALDGSAADTSTVTFGWSQISGPTSAGFADVTDPLSNFTVANTAGTHRLRLTASDGDATVASLVDLNATVTASPYSTWLTGFPVLTGNDALPESDPDQDGFINRLEFLLGGNPTASGQLISFLVTPGQRLALSFQRNTLANDIVLTVQASDTLTGTWTELAISSNGSPISALTPGVSITETATGSSREVTVEDTILTTDPLHPRRFLRLKVE